MDRAALLADEIHTLYSREGDIHVVLIYPNTYYLGMSSLGYQVLYHELNQREDTVCERAFLPEDGGVPLSLETGRPLSQFDIIGFSISFELDYFHVLRILKQANLPLFSHERRGNFPLVIAGGISVSYNPEPLADFIDVFVIGEAEEVIHEFIFEYRKHEIKVGLQHASEDPKRDLLLRLSHLEGIYVPCLYEVSYTSNGLIHQITHHPESPPVIHSAFVTEIDSLDTCSRILTPHTEFPNIHLIEIARGCGRQCRFCIAGYAHRWPRYRSLRSTLVCAEKAIGKTDRIGLVGSSVSDHPQIDEIAQGLVEMGFRISVASLRAETVRPPLLDALAESEQGTLTIAPEVATSHLQKIVNKAVSHERVFYVFEEALKRGILRLRLYFLLGVPYETEADVEAIVEMARGLKRIRQPYARRSGKSGKITFVFSPLVPKPHTPFQWIAMEPVKQISSKLRYLKKHLGMLGGFDVASASARLAEIEGVLARGDRRLGKVLYAVEVEDLPWKQAMRRAGLESAFYTQRLRHHDELFPWSHLNLRVDTRFLHQEHNKHHQGTLTSDCNVGSCRKCGACHLTAN